MQYQSQRLAPQFRYQHGAARAAKHVLQKGPREWREEYEDWDFPPKPKWMRWKTYNRLDEKAQAYEKAADDVFFLAGATPAFAWRRHRRHDGSDLEVMSPVPCSVEFRSSTRATCQAAHKCQFSGAAEARDRTAPRGRCGGNPSGSRGRDCRRTTLSGMSRVTAAPAAMRQAGARLAFGSDWPISGINPLRGIHAAVTRKAWKKGLLEQRQSLHDALLGYTATAPGRNSGRPQRPPQAQAEFDCGFFVTPSGNRLPSAQTRFRGNRFLSNVHILTLGNLTESAPYSVLRRGIRCESFYC